MASHNRPSKKSKQHHHHHGPSTSTSSTPQSQSYQHVQAASSAGAASFIEKHHPEKPSARFIVKPAAQPKMTPSASATTSAGGEYLPSGTGAANNNNNNNNDATRSIALPSSIVLNAQSKELRAWLVGQIARTCAIFCVNEIVVYNDLTNAPENASHGGNSSYLSTKHKPRGKYRDPAESDPTSLTGPEGGHYREDEDDPTTFLARILQYLETPQYLRKTLFPLHPSLRLAGLLPPLDLPHHLRRDDDSLFREGVVVQSPTSQSKGKGHQSSLLVDVGLWDPVQIDCTEFEPHQIPEVNVRVTVRMPPNQNAFAELVSPSTPRTEQGLYWGYSVRVAPSLAHVFSQSPFANEGGYDLSIGTSERGEPIQQALQEIEPFKHMILTLGPLSGLELVIASDSRIPLQAEEAGNLFDHWINVIEGQGSRTVRTEEALPIALARLKTTLDAMASLS